MFSIRSLYVISLLLLAFALTAWGQATEPDYVASFRSGNFNAAERQAKAATKQDSKDGKAWYYLGLARSGKSNFEGARKALLNANEYSGSQPHILTALAWAHLRLGDRSKAARYAREATDLDKNNAEAHYVFAVAALPGQNYKIVHARATSAIEADPNLWAAYRVRALALIGSFAQQQTIVIKDPLSRGELLTEAARDLETYIEKLPGADHGSFGPGYLRSLKYFASYYSELGRKEEIDKTSGNAPIRTTYKVTEKPLASYTSRARDARIGGNIRLVAQLRSDGRVGHILLLTSLGYGLDEEATRAASKIRFEPATDNGVPVDVVVTVDYGFAVY